VSDRTYPSNPSEAASRLLLQWLGHHYARSTVLDGVTASDTLLSGRATIGRRWTIAFAVADTVSPEANVAHEAARAAIEQRLDAAGRPVILWVPRGAALPTAEPGLSALALAVEQAQAIPDGRMEARTPVSLYFRRTGTTGSVVTVLGGLSAFWAEFTNKVPGTYQLNANELHRLPASQDERDALMRRVVNAAAQPDIDESQVLEAEEAWTVSPLEGDRSYVVGSPLPVTDDHSAMLRRNLRKLLQEVAPIARAEADARILVVLGAATYADDEKLSWALKGMDPRLYGGFDLILVAADGVVKPLLEPARGALPWDAPLA
jgi:hypothetical protein